MFPNVAPSDRNQWGATSEPNHTRRTDLRADSRLAVFRSLLCMGGGGNMNPYHAAPEGARPVDYEAIALEQREHIAAALDAHDSLVAERNRLRDALGRIESHADTTEDIAQIIREALHASRLAASPKPEGQE